MKKTFAYTISALSLLATLNTAQGVSYYVDVDSFGLFGTKIEAPSPGSSGSSVSSDFNIINNGGDSALEVAALFLGIPPLDGYDKTTEYITDAWAVFWVTDDPKHIFDLSPDEGDEKIEIHLGGTSAFGPSEVEILEFKGGGLGLSALIDLSDDGILSYEVKATEGDFLLLGAGLKATFASKPVPDTGSTLGIISLGLIALFIAGRRLR